MFTCVEPFVFVFRLGAAARALGLSVHLPFGCSPGDTPETDDNHGTVGPEKEGRREGESP